MATTFHAVKVAAEISVLRYYGLEKQALDLKGLKDLGANALKNVDVKSLFTRGTVGPRKAGVGGALRWAGGHAKEMARNAVFGTPYELRDQLKQSITDAGGSKGRGVLNYMKTHYWNPKGKLDTALQGLNLASIGYSGYRAAQTEDPEERKRALTRFGVGLAVQPFTGKLGIPGAIAQQALTRGAERLVAGPQRPQRPQIGQNPNGIPFGYPAGYVAPPPPAAYPMYQPR